MNSTFNKSVIGLILNVYFNCHKLGNGASSWILHMATIIITSNLWGIKFGEWKGVSKKTFTILVIGVAVIIISVLLGGLAKYIESAN